MNDTQQIALIVVYIASTLFGILLWLLIMFAIIRAAIISAHRKLAADRLEQYPTATRKDLR